MSDYYSTLGVDRSASADEIKRAYRKMAGQHHPDRGGDTGRFQEIEEAYRTLSDPQKRTAYDNPNPFGGGHHAGGAPGGFHFNFGDIFNMFGGVGVPPGFGPRQQQTFTRMSLWVQLTDIITGGRRPVSISTPQGASIVEIEIPVGINDGDNVRYPGIGPNGVDLVVQFRIHPNAKWERQGLNLITEQAVDVWDLILGNDIEFTGPIGNHLIAAIPPNTQPKSVLRLRNKGIKDQNGQIGDLMIRINARIPDNIHPALLAAIEKYRK